MVQLRNLPTKSNNMLLIICFQQNFLLNWVRIIFFQFVQLRRNLYSSVQNACDSHVYYKYKFLDTCQFNRANIGFGGKTLSAKLFANDSLFTIKSQNIPGFVYIEQEQEEGFINQF
jgi:hypothetical protein